MKFVLGACIVILTVMVAGAVFFVVPPAEGLGNLVRIAFLHIPAAWVSVIAFFMSAWWAAAYLRRGNIRDDARSFSSARLGFVFTLLATVSGAVFSKLTWGAYWNWDPRQTTILVLLLIYGAYLTLRAAMEEYNRRARVSAVYSLFSFLTVPFLVFIVPRLFFSLHPTPVLNGSGSVDMDPVMLVTLFAAAADATLIYIWLLLKSSRKEEKI
ncbi:heme exporter protein C [Schwartzia succinivorans DSM 10502]|uniref:Heme exporter protein C n=1 Tax=Schwartzia succinivorans DSM 10502 TaxID=1123243 RepID=A0A1M4ZRT1_9FIRM|nr:heme exporter protein C [Schwartzia succinivorans DSM 10502]